MDDGFIAVRNYSIDNREMKSEQLKDVKFEVDKLITMNITNFIDYPTQQFGTRSNVFHPDTNQYVMIKKYDDTRKVYLCKAKNIP